MATHCALVSSLALAAAAMAGCKPRVEQGSGSELLAAASVQELTATCFGSDQALTSAEIQALASYTGSGYTAMNGGLRQNTWRNDPTLAESITNAACAANKLRTGKPCWAKRFLNVDHDVVEGWRQQGWFSDPGFQSSTLLDKRPPFLNDASDVILIRTKSCPHVERYSSNKSEREVLFPPGTRFKVTDKGTFRDVGGKFYDSITVEEVLPSEGPLNPETGSPSPTPTKVGAEDPVSGPQPAPAAFDVVVHDPSLSSRPEMCILRAGTAECFDMVTGQSLIAVQTGVKKVAMDDNVICVVYQDGRLGCFVHGDSGAADTDMRRIPAEMPRDAIYADVIVNCNGFTACGHRKDGSVLCWGRGAADFQTNFDNMGSRFNQISCEMAACSLTDTRMACSGYGLNQSRPFKRLRRLSGGYHAACAVGEGPTKPLICVQDPDPGTTENYPTKQYADVVDVKVSLQSLCVLDEGDGLRCTGFPSLGLVRRDQIREATHLAESYRMICAVGPSSADCYYRKVPGTKRLKTRIPEKYRNLIRFADLN